MDSKFFVSYEAARLLKEKGYNEECTTLYDCIFNEIIPARSVGLYRNESINRNESIKDDYCSCPTKAEAIDWLELNDVVITTYNVSNKWAFMIRSRKFPIYDSDMEDELYPTRLEAEDAAIIKALELLK